MHTPLPWEVETPSHNDYPYALKAINGDNHKKGAVGTRILRWGAFMLPSSDEAKANAAFIVRACNSHYDLVEALEALFNSYKELADSGDAGFWSLEDQPVGKQALAALAKAKEINHG